jgi:hypothetical protein
MYAQEKTVKTDDFFHEIVNTIIDRIPEDEHGDFLLKVFITIRDSKMKMYQVSMDEMSRRKSLLEKFSDLIPEKNHL